MNSNENNLESKVENGLGFKLFSALSKVNTELIAVVIIALLSLQVLYGLFEPVVSQMELASLYYGKTIIIRLLGYLGIANCLIDF